MLLPWLALALAAPPNKTARVFSIAGTDGGTDRLGNMQVSADGRLVTGRTANTGIGFLMDVDSWRLTTFAGCDVRGIGVDSFDTVWFGCNDGRIIPKIYFRGELFDVLAADGGVFEIQAVLATGHDVVAMWMDPIDEYLFLFSYGDDQTVQVFSYDPITLADVDIDQPFVTSALVPDFTESEFVYLNSVTTPSVMMTYGTNQHGQFTYTTTDTGVTGGAIALIAAQGTENCTDWNDSFYGLYCLDGQIDQLLQYNGAQVNAFTTISASLGPLDEPKAVVVSDIEGDSWMAVTGGQVQVWELDDNGNFVTPDTPAFVGDPTNDNEIQDGVASESVLFGGGINGNLHVSLAAPWMKNGPTSSFVTQDPDPAASGDTVTLTFEWDESVAWTAYLGGDRNEPGGVLTSGEAEADESVSVDVVVDEAWGEGENDIIFYGEALEDGLVGHGWLGVNVDNPPSAPTLTESSVDVGESRLTVSFSGITDEDLAYYELYVSTESFEPSDYETGGPSLGVAPAVNPKVLEGLPGASVSYELGPLENGTTYYVAVRAFDLGGKESPMSNVVSGVPEQTFGAAELAGETGGSSCSTSSTGGAIGSLALAALMSLRRRRGAALAGSMLMGALVPGVAQAQDDDKWWRADQTPAVGNFEVRYGGITLEDPYINRVYNTTQKNLLQVEFGPQILRVLEIDASIGFFQELDKSQFSNGSKSADRTMLTWYQFGLDATLRAHLIDEQPVVPFVRYGWDYVQFSEKKVVFGGEEDVTRGGNPGSHWAIGGNLLLDLLQPGRASLLEARTGINDTWLTVEWRRQSIDSRSRPWQAPVDTGSDFIFSGDIFQVGLKLDY